ncbi:unnamed protein product [Bursaphelenchus xylophilus]|uniref:(pine wood nematode) hypothetical protein n=1 Tax=Bursaphelenchus xylophilus TaxID=6326 RepID=A0A1I7SFX8_BURXY|nr:unnamed protein product [Bursaphelenchus xylophilus]CAG9122073.1 unnamed protein product [Bursaphelenchus xylophilus]
MPDYLRRKREMDNKPVKVTFEDGSTGAKTGKSISKVDDDGAYEELFAKIYKEVQRTAGKTPRVRIKRRFVPKHSENREEEHEPNSEQIPDLESEQSPDPENEEGHEFFTPVSRRTPKNTTPKSERQPFTGWKALPPITPSKALEIANSLKGKLRRAPDTFGISEKGFLKDKKGKATTFNAEALLKQWAKNPVVGADTVPIDFLNKMYKNEGTKDMIHQLMSGRTKRERKQVARGVLLKRRHYRFKVLSWKYKSTPKVLKRH